MLAAVPFIVPAVLNNTSPAAASPPVSVSIVTSAASMTSSVPLKSTSAVAPPSVDILPPRLAVAALTVKAVNSSVTAPTVLENVAVPLGADTVNDCAPPTVLEKVTSPEVAVTIGVPPLRVKASFTVILLSVAVKLAAKLIAVAPFKARKS